MNTEFGVAGMKPRVSTALCLILFLALTACGGVGPSVQPDDWEQPVSPYLTVHFLDVGQGDSAVIVTPEGRVILIDAGTSSAGDDVVEALNELGVESINLAIISHAHADHIGGLENVLGAFPVLHFGDPAFPHPSEMYAELLEQVLALEIPSQVLESGDWIPVEDKVDLFVLSPSPPFIEGSRSDVNSNTVVLLLVFDEVSVLFMGDAEHETESRLLAEGWLRDIDVLKVAHHGSAYATTATFLEVTRPEVAIISCGADNSYGHPAPETVEALERVAPGAVYRTDLDGTIIVTTDGRELVVEIERVRSLVGELQ